MLFNSYEFLFLFLPMVLIGYYVLAPKGARLGFLTVVSYLFYGWWDYRFCSLMLISTLIDYQAGKRIYDASNTKVRRRWLTLSAVSNLSLLGFFKYFDLTAQTINQVSAALGLSAEPLIPLLHVVLPVGISFYTFQSMSYSIDIYLGAAKPARGLWAFACYVALFPQLIAGPIVRYRDLAEQLVERTHSWAKASLGISFFIAGLAKKVILADGAALLVPAAFESANPGFLASWVGTLAYTMQIYFDFSGYSDMAVGLGLMLGFRFPQNFNSPYKALSITDFWRRWHITLSSWLRDYLYIPLGGNRFGSARTYINLFVTMLLGGLWHGANWTFVVWGGYHGILLALERAMGKRGWMAWAPVSIQQGATFLLVMGGWVFFRATSLDQAGAIFSGLLGMNGVDADVTPLLVAQPLASLMLLLSLIIAFLCPNSWEIRWRANPALFVLLALLLTVSIMIVFLNAASPFLYFQF